MKDILEEFEKRKEKIRKRLKEFKEMKNKDDEEIFAELAFCLCTPQSKATLCWNAISTLMKNGLLYKGSVKQIRSFLNEIRFGDKKAEYIVAARNFFANPNWKLKKILFSFKNVYKLREWLANNVKGLGTKESSHFLRNIGLGFNLAILDRHILKNLKELGVIKEIPKRLNEKIYLEIEEKMKKFAERNNLKLQELDLLLWSKETGFVFK